MRRCVMGLDIGTTCAKACVVEESGHVLGTGSAGYGLLTHGDAVEQQVVDWIDGAAKAARAALETAGEIRVEGISLSTQGGTTAAVDAEGRVLGPAWTWMDSRSLPEAREAETALGGEFIYRVTGFRVSPAMDLSKLRRMRAEPALRGAAKYYTTLEIMNRWLTGNPAIDPTNASLRQLFSLEGGDWDDRLLAFAGVSRDELPDILPTSALVGTLGSEAAAALGVAPGVPVFNGALDQYCAALGAGAVRASDLLLSAGTTWVLLAITEKPLFSRSYIAPGRHPAGNLCGALASLTASGAALQWFKDNFMPEDFTIMNREAAARVARTEKLFFLPWQAGANYPVWESSARGVFAGLTLEHDRFDLARAIMEGVAFGVRRALEDFAENGVPIRQIRMLGGAAKSDLWTRMVAAAAGVSVVRLDQSEVCALGAAAIAGVAAGIFTDYGAASAAMTRPEPAIKASPEEIRAADAKYQRYIALSRAMSAFYHE